ncbi:MAG TPA: hypothetical protein PK397_07910 [Ignavibacteriaceae bacterium]|nr:hypothetical protein [Ignavibacteriaceae bacterium]
MKKAKSQKTIEFPFFCDYSCKYASFSKKEIVGDCRKEVAVWCKHFKKFNNKNTGCIGRK